MIPSQFHNYSSIDDFNPIDAIIRLYQFHPINSYEQWFHLIRSISFYWFDQFHPNNLSYRTQIDPSYLSLLSNDSIQSIPFDDDYIRSMISPNILLHRWRFNPIRLIWSSQFHLTGSSDRFIPWLISSNLFIYQSHAFNQFAKSESVSFDWRYQINPSNLIN